MSKPVIDSQLASHSYQFAGKDVPWLMAKQAEQRPDKIFLIWEPVDGNTKQWTYREFWEAANALAYGLLEAGLAKGDKLLIHCENCPEMMIAWYASAIIGSVAVTTNTRCVGDELRYFAEHSEASLCITQPKFINALSQHAHTIKNFYITKTNSDETVSHQQQTAAASHQSFQSLFKTGRTVPKRPAEPMLPVGIQFTSGTTSRPKAVVHTHANALWGGISGSANLQMGETDTYLCFLPCFHVNAQSWTFWTMSWIGGSVVLQPKFSASRFWEVSLKHRCTRASMIPFCFKAIATQDVPEHFYKSWATGVKLHNVEKHWRVKSFATWGMTETVTHATRSYIDKDCPEMNIGMPSPGYEFAIIDSDTGQQSEIGVNGDLWIRGTRGIEIFLEYYNAPEENNKAFNKEGWFHTGDRIRLEEDGYLYFADRDKDVLKVGAENVSARQIEEFIGNLLGMGVLEEHYVVAQKHSMLDEVPVVFAIKSFWTNQTEDQIRELILAGCMQLADFKRPRAVYFLEEFPRATLDKVAKNKLREMANKLAEQS